MRIKVRVGETEIEVEDHLVGDQPVATAYIGKYYSDLDNRIKDMLDIAIEKGAKDANTIK